MRQLIRAGVVLVMTVLACPCPAAAQAAGRRWEVGGHLAGVRSGEFADTDVGGGGRLAWLALPTLAVEGEVTAYRSDYPDGKGRTRLEGLFGVTAGPRLGRLRPFAKARAGFLRYPQAAEAILCVATYPPPLGCTLAAGETVTAYDVGGGIEAFASPRTVLRLDVSDRMLRYPGPARRAGGERTDGASVGHDLRVALGAGWRF